jgi:hypothetical protein
LALQGFPLLFPVVCVWRMPSLDSIVHEVVKDLAV